MMNTSLRDAPCAPTDPAVVSAPASASSAGASAEIERVPTRLGAAARAVAGLARDPNRLDLVFVLAESLNGPLYPRVIARLQADPEGRRILAERPAIDSRNVDFDGLAALPDGTLGREYVRFLRDNAISPDVFRPPAGVDERIAYAVQRIRQTHDLWHVLTGYAPDVRGELLLQAFVFAQIRAPSALALSVLGGLRYGCRRKGFFRELRKAYRRGRATRSLATLRWEEYWAEPVSELRRRLQCPVDTLS
jgi:ubiquinone biosynthesis protein COQ4